MNRFTMRWAALSMALTLSSFPSCGAGELTTNLVEVLPHVLRFAEALELEMDTGSVTTNSVTEFRPYRGIGGGCGLTIDNRWGFAFDVKHAFVKAFTDRERSMGVLWREEDLKPLMKPSRLDKEGALKVALMYLGRLGYRIDDYPVRKPEVHQWKWQPVEDEEAIMLPFFEVIWEWIYRDRARFFVMEIDGLRERVVYFSTMDKSFAVADMERHLGESSKSDNLEHE